MEKKDVFSWLDDNQQLYTQMADEIWANPEIRFEEFKASKLQADFLEEAGFDITWDIGGLNTAFSAEYTHGVGGPIIGFAGEYDALPGLSQTTTDAPDPIVAGGHGHGCGHNILGTGCLAAAHAVKQWLIATDTPGTVRYYGCPAEEGGCGKVYMTRDGAFDDLDAAFNYHPSHVNFASKGSNVGVHSYKFRFQGRTSHAGGSPHMGRSALDAVELMNIGVNFLREHTEDKTRIHYVITDGGGPFPNIVPDHAEVYYYVRAHLPHQVADLVRRVTLCAEGAAKMTETKLEIEQVHGASCVLNNHVLADLQYQAMQEIGPIEFSEEELAFADAINKNNPPGVDTMVAKQIGLPPGQQPPPMVAGPYPSLDIGDLSTGSTDVGDLSWQTPLSMLRTACWPTNVAAHSWGVVASGGTGLGHKGMMYAAKVMARAAIELYQNEELLQSAQAEFAEATAATEYVSPLPADKQPPTKPNPYR